MEYAIITENLTKTIGWFRPHLIVNSLNLQVGVGSIFGLVGPNGAGKTTCFKLLLGLSRISSGTAAIFGTPVPSPSSRQHVGYLPEVVNHPDYLSVEEYLSYHAGLASISQWREKMVYQLGRLGMAGSEHLLLGTLSKGMRQRVDLARVLMLDARLILLDEPVTGLDPLGQAALKEILLQLKKEGRTTILNSHAIGILADVCDEVGILAAGRMQLSGHLDQLLQTRDAVVTVRGRVEDPLALIPGRTDGESAERLEGGTWNLRLRGRDSLVPVIKKCLDAGLEIVAANTVRLTLEELFTRTLGKHSVIADSIAVEADPQSASAGPHQGGA